MAIATASSIEQLLGAKAESLLGFKNPKISRERLHVPGPDFIDRVYAVSDRNVRVLTCLLYTSPSPRDLSTSRMPSSA